MEKESSILFNLTPLKEILGNKFNYNVETKINDRKLLVLLKEEETEIKNGKILLKEGFDVNNCLKVIEEENINDPDLMLKVLKEITSNKKENKKKNKNDTPYYSFDKEIMFKHHPFHYVIYKEKPEISEVEYKKINDKYLIKRPITLDYIISHKEKTYKLETDTLSVAIDHNENYYKLGKSTTLATFQYFSEQLSVDFPPYSTYEAAKIDEFSKAMKLFEKTI